MDDFDIEFLKIERQPKDELLLRLTDTNAKFVIFGSGYFGNQVASSLKNLGGRLVAFCDNFKTGINEDFQLQIITPEQLLQDYQDANIVVAVGLRFMNVVYNQVVEMGFPKSNIFRRNDGYALYDVDKIKQHYDDYKWAYNFFADDISKKLVLDRLRMHLLGTVLSKTSSAPQYFDPEIISLSDNEVFIDGGAFTGDTAEEFIKQTNVGGYRYIYSFEPDDAVRGKAISNLEEFDKLDVIGKGLWSCDSVLQFFSDGGNSGGSSFVNGDYTISVPVTSIDSFFEDKPNNELPTFIKLDIEGAEKEALIGAKNIIRQKHPKLAICAYHKPEDIYELPKLIYETDPSYRFSLRQCKDGIYETVLYAV